MRAARRGVISPTAASPFTDPSICLPEAWPSAPRNREERDQARGVAGRGDELRVAVGVEGDDRQVREGGVELAAVDGVVEALARLAPRGPDVDEESAAERLFADSGLVDGERGVGGAAGSLEPVDPVARSEDHGRGGRRWGLSPRKQAGTDDGGWRCLGAEGDAFPRLRSHAPRPAPAKRKSERRGARGERAWDLGYFEGLKNAPRSFFWNWSKTS